MVGALCIVLVKEARARCANLEPLFWGNIRLGVGMGIEPVSERHAAGIRRQYVPGSLFGSRRQQ
jgi:hypothetical protein